ncbi:sigma 54-interacting transcriptional regulator [Polycladomyces subterraneus]|uniref:Sigma 54-interacting transcriptional regulator n=1 Tax=Polycladomyces subterraneus TaxID=1016997 RepID=A0ABT8INC3_9BACL|nr:sigma-54-dependent transcriptional regulator [Polycladomyces subterraneus]MDN4594274.1 sigma 54-interacting transcriptional regulator [Polycladomyces subterraneus]
MKKTDLVENTLRSLSEQYPHGISAEQMGRELYLDRSTASRYLNELVREGKARKIPGRPVKYLPHPPAKTEENSGKGAPDSMSPSSRQASVGELFTDIVGAKHSLRSVLEEALAAVMYPPHGLPMLITGETGTGKSHLAHTLYRIAAERGRLRHDAPFVAFNCAEYAQNPELLMGQLFGVKKGAFTGAVNDRPGLVERADGGVLFLDEIHRLPPAGQEMLFYLIDQGVFRRLGETTMERRARVLLIGATTETPETVLLPTLYRRFSVKVTLPPLRERTREEREILLRRFLEREEEKMGAPLTLSDECRQMLLTYPCKGNIGQLQSDVQIACARAFLRHLQQPGPRVTVTIEDLPQTVLQEASKKTATIDGKPLPRKQRKADQIPNIYEQLVRRKQTMQESGANDTRMSQSLEEVVDQYVRVLMQTSRQDVDDLSGGARLIEPELYKILHEAVSEAEAFLPSPVGVHQLTAVGLHMQAWLNDPERRRNLSSLPEIPPAPDPYIRAAECIATHIKARWGLDLPAREVKLIALILSPRDQKQSPERRVAVLVAMHGESAAHSMADVTNSLLGSPVIHAVDMPLHQPSSVAFERIKQTVRQIDQGAGVLLLVDIGSLTTMGEAISRELGIAVETVPHVSLPMVIEAGRKALYTENRLEEVADAVRRAAQLPTTLSDRPPSRIIATVCYTGEGAAVTLENWLREHLPDADRDVTIRSVRIDPESRRSPLLEHLARTHRLIAVVGTVAPELPGVPYLPAWEMLQPEGVGRLKQLLSATRTATIFPSRSDRLTYDRIPSLVEQGLLETSRHLNPRLFCRIMQKEMDVVREQFDLSADRELGLWMHVGTWIDQWIGARLDGQIPECPQPESDSQPSEVSPSNIRAWQRVLDTLSQTFSVSIPEQMAIHLCGLSRRSPST